MRTFVRVVLVSFALTSASLATACPTDPTPSKEMVALNDLSVPSIASIQNIGDTLSGMVAEEPNLAPARTLLLDHEGDGVTTARIVLNEDALSQVTEAVAAVATELQTDAENIVVFDTTGSADPSALTPLAEPELALDGYEDR